MALLPDFVYSAKIVSKLDVDAILNAIRSRCHFENLPGWLVILENGYSFNNKDEMTTIRGALLAFPRDTLANNYFGGFKESPSFSFSRCRLCTIIKSIMKSVCSENQVTLLGLTTRKKQVKVILNRNLSLPVIHTGPKCFFLDIMHVLYLKV